MRRKHLTAALLMGALAQPRAHAVIIGDIPALTAALQSDLNQIATWTNDQIAQGIPFNQSAGDSEISWSDHQRLRLAAYGALTSTVLDRDRFHHLPTTFIDTSDTDIPSRATLPLLMGELRWTSLSRTSLSFRAGGVPSTEVTRGNTTVKAKNTIWGFSLAQGFGQANRPGFDVALNFSRATGDLSTTFPLRGRQQFTVTEPSQPSITGTSTLTVPAKGQSSWNTTGIGGALTFHMGSEKFQPFIGLHVDRYTGSVNTEIKAEGDVTADAVTFPVSLSATGGSDPVQWLTRGVLGFQSKMGPIFFHLSGSYGERKSASGKLGIGIEL